MNMHPTEDLNFNEICRCCLYQKRSGKLKPLFGSAIDAMLSELIGFPVLENDDLPQLICIQCVLHISRAYTFRTQCIKSHNTLQEHLARRQSLNRTVLPPVAEVLQPLLSDPQQVESQFVIELTSGQFIRLNCDDTFGATTATVTGEFTDLLVAPSPTVTSIGIVQEEVEQQPHHSILGVNVSNAQDNDSLLLAHPPSLPITAPEEENDDDEDGDDSQSPSEEEEMPDTNDIYGEVLDELNSMAAAAVAAESIAIITAEPPPPPASAPPPSAQNINFLVSSSYSNSSSSSSATSSAAISTPSSPEFTCDKCQMTYATILALTYHQSRAHSLDHRPSECDVCGKTFGTQKAIRRHMKTHLSRKPHVCSTCGAAFADSSNLAQHEKSHRGERRNAEPVTCDECGKRFKWVTSLTKHRKYHTGRNLHKCPVAKCGKVFAEANGLRLHRLVHEDETRFQCTLCNMRFKLEANLKRHQHIHDNVKQYKCTVCGRDFRQSTHLKDHMQTHRGNVLMGQPMVVDTKKKKRQRLRPQKCPNCGEEFIVKVLLNRHLKSCCVDTGTVSADHQAMAFLRDELLAEMEGRQEMGGEQEGGFEIG